MTTNTHNNATHETHHAKDEVLQRDHSNHDPLETLKQDMAAIVADTEELLRHSVDAIGAPAIAARARLIETLNRAKERTANGLGQLRQRGQRAVGIADDYVRERTWQSIGIAALAGVVVGVLFARRTKS